MTDFEPSTISNAVRDGAAARVTFEAMAAAGRIVNRPALPAYTAVPVVPADARAQSRPVEGVPMNTQFKPVSALAVFRARLEVAPDRPDLALDLLHSLLDGEHRSVGGVALCNSLASCAAPSSRTVLRSLGASFGSAHPAVPADARAQSRPVESNIMNTQLEMVTASALDVLAHIESLIGSEGHINVTSPADIALRDPASALGSLGYTWSRDRWTPVGDELGSELAPRTGVAAPASDGVILYAETIEKVAVQLGAHAVWGELALLHFVSADSSRLPFSTTGGVYTRLGTNAAN